MSTTDIAFAPEGSIGTLQIKDTAERLGLGFREMAAAASCGISTLHGVIGRNQWPKRTLVRCERLLELLRSKGASEDELNNAFLLKEVTPRATKKGAASQSNPEIDMLMGKQSLTPTARRAFGLAYNPFDAEVSSDEEMFTSSEIRFVREACWATGMHGSFVAVMGESGAGKTTIVADLKERVLNSPAPIIMIEPSVLGMTGSDSTGKMLKAGDILAAGVCSLAPNTLIKQSIEARTRQFVKLLEDSITAGNRHLLVIEEAHDLPVATLQHLKRLHERTRVGRKSALGILLVGHPELHDKLKKVREVFQRCEPIFLRPLDNELTAYLSHKAKLANKALAELITQDGIDEIRARLTLERRGVTSQAARTVSMTYPLVVNNLFIAALNLAAELGADIVDKNVVREVR